MSNSEMVQPTQGDIAAQARWLGQFPDMHITPEQVERLREEFARHRAASFASGLDRAARVVDKIAAHYAAPFPDGSRAGKVNAAVARGCSLAAQAIREL